MIYLIWTAPIGCLFLHRPTLPATVGNLRCLMCPLHGVVMVGHSFPKWTEPCRCQNSVYLYPHIAHSWVASVMLGLGRKRMKTSYGLSGEFLSFRYAGLSYGGHVAGAMKTVSVLATIQQTWFVFWFFDRFASCLLIISQLHPFDDSTPTVGSFISITRGTLLKNFQSQETKKKNKMYTQKTRKQLHSLKRENKTPTFQTVRIQDRKNLRRAKMMDLSSGRWLLVYVVISKRLHAKCPNRPACHR